MADINRSSGANARSAGRGGPVKGKPRTHRTAASEDEDLVSLIELLFFAYRDFTGEPDAILDQFGFGRAHHRVLHFVSRNPGLRVAHLLEILNITKQSLARVLKQLIDEGFISQRAGAEDRRERLLYVTAKGAKLTQKLTELQVARIKAALSEAGVGADAVVQRFFLTMIAETDRDHVRSLVRLSDAQAATASAPNSSSNRAHRKREASAGSQLTNDGVSASDLPPVQSQTDQTQEEQQGD